LLRVFITIKNYINKKEDKPWTIMMKKIFLIKFLIKK